MSEFDGIDASNYEIETQCGFVAIVGRPNVGKSTLLNHILGQKISITSRKPQTTRQQILGIKTEDKTQVVYVDTPGLHQDQPKAINRYMNRAASTALKDVDVIAFVIDRLQWTDEDNYVLDKIKHSNIPVVLIVNKIDQIEDKQRLLPHLQMLGEKMDFAEIMPMSALSEDDVARFEVTINKRMKKGLFYYPEDQITDRTERFLSAEIIREKIMRQIGDEIPYEIAVEIEKFTFEGHVLHIHGLILVEREGQKRIIIGDKGSKIKQVGTDARHDMERLFDCKVMLHTWVKVKGGWSDDDRALRSLGLDDKDL